MNTKRKIEFGVPQRVWLAAVLAAAAAGAPAAPVYKCTDAEGHVAFQDRACAVAERTALVEIAPAPPPPRAAASDARSPPLPRTPRRNAVRASSAGDGERGTSVQSYECRAADGEVFYRHSGCPKSIVAASDHGRGARATRNTSGHAKAERAVAVSAQPLSRAEACKRMSSAGSIGRAGHEHDDNVSTYDRNAGRDPCRRW